MVHVRELSTDIARRIVLADMIGGRCASKGGDHVVGADDSSASNASGPLPYDLGKVGEDRICGIIIGCRRANLTLVPGRFS
jgi:hypothetical protein